MKDINLALRKAYYKAMEPIRNENIPVHYGYLPENVNLESYIIFSHVSNVDSSTKSSSDNTHIMQIAIHTANKLGNTGFDCDTLANKIFEIFYNTTQAKLDLSASNLQMLSTELYSDQTQDFNDSAGNTFNTRILQFKHEVYIL
jgi:hypothetical protein